jgi:hypothetical protein
MNWLIFLWKHGGRKIFHIWKQVSSDSEVDIPSNPIEEFNETVQNIQLSQEEPCETENEQSLAIEDQLEIMEDDFTETYIEY